MNEQDKPTLKEIAKYAEKLGAGEISIDDVPEEVLKEVRSNPEAENTALGEAVRGAERAPDSQTAHEKSKKKRK